VLGRALVMAGRVGEGLDRLDVAAGSPGDDARIARFTRAAAALQLGAPELVDEELWAEIDEGRTLGLGGAEPVVALALRSLQGGDAAAASELLADAAPDLDDVPSVVAARALVAAARGEGSAHRHAAVVAAADDATYLDLAIAELGAALEAAASDTGAAEAQHRISVARAEVHATEDQVARTVVELAAAAVAARLDLPERDEVAAHAEHLSAKLGIEAAGWRRAFALALRSPLG
jgi:hypothetical protein